LSSPMDLEWVSSDSSPSVRVWKSRPKSLLSRVRFADGGSCFRTATCWHPGSRSCKLLSKAFISQIRVSDSGWLLTRFHQIRRSDSLSAFFRDH
jgi:hypothetical protein